MGISSQLLFSAVLIFDVSILELEKTIFLAVVVLTLNANEKFVAG